MERRVCCILSLLFTLSKIPKHISVVAASIRQERKHVQPRPLLLCTRKLAQFMSNHVLSNFDGNVIFAVVDVEYDAAPQYKVS